MVNSKKKTTLLLFSRKNVERFKKVLNMCSLMMMLKASTDGYGDHVTFVNNKMTAKLKHNLVLLVRDLHSSSREASTHSPSTPWPLLLVFFFPR